MSFVQTTQKIYQFARNEPRMFKPDHHFTLSFVFLSHILSKLFIRDSEFRADTFVDIFKITTFIIEISRNVRSFPPTRRKFHIVHWELNQYTPRVGMYLLAHCPFLCLTNCPYLSPQTSRKLRHPAGSALSSDWFVKSCYTRKDAAINPQFSY